MTLAAELQVEDIRLDAIYLDNAFNCRGEFSPFEVRDLVESIVKVGLQSPITVQPYNMKDGKQYRVVMGHRRFMAFQVLKRETIPCIIKPGLSETDARILNLKENLDRKNLNILQEAKALENLKLAGISKEKVAKEIGQSSGWIQVRWALLGLPADIQKEAAAGFLNQTHIKQLASLPRGERMYSIVREIKESKLRGECRKITVKDSKDKKDYEKKEPRSVKDIFLMQDVIRDAIGNCLATRALAWAAGFISERAFHNSLKDFADENGFKYQIPLDLRNNE